MQMWPLFEEEFSEFSKQLIFRKPLNFKGVSVKQAALLLPLN